VRLVAWKRGIYDKPFLKIPKKTQTIITFNNIKLIKALLTKTRPNSNKKDKVKE
jgi:hypothetical protein